MIQTMKAFSGVTRTGLIALLALTMPMLAQAAENEAVEPEVETGVRAMAMEAEAVITAIDLETREVTLQGPSGDSFTLQSQEKVVKLEDVQVGDAVVVTYLAALESEVREPTAEEIAGRLTGYYNKDEGWIKNVYDGNTVNDSDDWGIRGKLLWNPTDTLELKWSSDYSDRSSNCCNSAFRSLDPYPAQPPNNQQQVDDILAQLAPVVPGDKNRKVNLNSDLFPCLGL